MSNAVLQLKVSLKGAKPPIWRRLQVRSDVTQDELHAIIRAAFTWYGADRPISSSRAIATAPDAQTATPCLGA
jgi:hypothetical protein